MWGKFDYPVSPLGEGSLWVINCCSSQLSEGRIPFQIRNFTDRSGFRSVDWCDFL
jgi:hypothetical protein